ncbi:MAG: U32 family peptidase [Proteobacteria bacterium]|nr:MAG: U32 family peptidase [Pseudomonadota bacterium]
MPDRPRRPVRLELVCPAGSLPALKAAVDHGADAVYVGFRDATNARHFAGLNFDDRGARRALDYAHAAGVRVFAAINTYPRADGWSQWTAAVDRAAGLGVDTLIVADIGVMDYAASQHADLPLHLSVQGSATSAEAIRFYAERFGIRRAVLPRVLSLRRVCEVAGSCEVPIEVFGFGSLCVMAEGRCMLSSYVTGRSPNTFGACSPADAVEWRECGGGLETRLNGVLVDRFGPGDRAGYPTLCKGRFNVLGGTGYAIEEPTSLNSLSILPELMRAGVAAIKVEGRQRSPAYVARVTKVLREAIDSCRADPGGFRVEPRWNASLSEVSEGAQTTLGAYHRPWR